MERNIDRRALLVGFGALGFLGGCRHPKSLHTISMGLDEEKVQVQFTETGLKSWVYRDQIFLNTSSDPWTPALTALADLDRDLVPGDKVVIIHRVIKELPQGLRITIIVYDILAVAGLITLSIVTLGATSALTSLVILDPNQPTYDAVVRTNAEHLGLNAQVQLRGSLEEPQLRYLDPGDVSLFYQLEAESPILGPGTTLNVSDLNLWGEQAEWLRINTAVVEWMRTVSTVSISGMLRSLIYGVARQPLRTRNYLLTPITLWITSNHRSSENGHLQKYVLRYRNDFGPTISGVLIAMRLARGLRLESQGGTDGARYFKSELPDDEGTAHCWYLRRMSPDQKGKIRVRVQVDMARL